MRLAGGQAAVARLVDEHYAALYRYAYRLSGSPDQAADLTQETFCKAQAQYAQLRDKNRVKGWLFSILRNAYLHQVRADRAHRIVSLDQMGGEATGQTVGDLVSDRSDPFPEVDPQRLQAALNELAEPFRTPLVLYYFEDFSYRAIAEEMGLPMGTVMSRLARAKAYLRDRLCPPPPPDGRS